MLEDGMADLIADLRSGSAEARTSEPRTRGEWGGTGRDHAAADTHLGVQHEALVGVELLPAATDRCRTATTRVAVRRITRAPHKARASVESPPDTTHISRSWNAVVLDRGASCSPRLELRQLLLLTLGRRVLASRWSPSPAQGIEETHRVGALGARRVSASRRRELRAPHEKSRPPGTTEISARLADFAFLLRRHLARLVCVGGIATRGGRAPLRTGLCVFQFSRVRARKHGGDSRSTRELLQSRGCGHHAAAVGGGNGLLARGEVRLSPPHTRVRHRDARNARHAASLPDLHPTSPARSEGCARAAPHSRRAPLRPSS